MTTIVDILVELVGLSGACVSDIILPPGRRDNPAVIAYELLADPFYGYPRVELDRDSFAEVAAQLEEENHE